MAEKSAPQKPTKHIKPAAKITRTKRPEGMSLEDWQIGLRREHGRTQDFDIKNLGEEPIFSEFLGRNAKSQSSYNVIIRGNNLGDNSCTCGDFTTNAPRHLQTHRMHPRQAGTKARRQGGARTRLPTRLQRNLPPLRQTARSLLPPRHRLPAELVRLARALFLR